MYLYIMFDIVRDTPERKKNAIKFVRKLEQCGFSRLQYSVYLSKLRVASDAVQKEECIITITKELNLYGEIRMLRIDDEQHRKCILLGDREESLTIQAIEQDVIIF